MSLCLVDPALQWNVVCPLVGEVGLERQQVGLRAGRPVEGAADVCGTQGTVFTPEALRGGGKEVSSRREEA